MNISRKYLHDRVVLILLTLLAALLVIGVSIVLLRFDASKNPTTIAQYRQNLSGSGYVSGKPADIYLLALFMLFTAIAGLVLSLKTYPLKRYISIFILGSAVFCMILAIIVANSLISLQ